MATPPNTRSVLSEIGDHSIRPRLAVTPTGEIANDPIPTNVLNNSFDDPLGYLEPALPSPDEIVIRQRGRRRIKLNWSPSKCPTPSRCPFQKTPTKTTGAIQMTLRSSPRKRLLDGLSFQTTPEKATNKASPMKVSSGGGTNSDQSSSTTPLIKRLMLEEASPSPNSKRLRLDDAIPLMEQLKSDEKNFGHLNRKLPLRARLNQLNQKELVSVVLSMVQQNAQMEAYVKKILPKPDLSAMSDDLKRIARNINRCMPKTTSRQTVAATTSQVRAEPYLTEFKNEIVTQTTHLYKAHRWSSILDYHKIVWPIICSLPSASDNPIHNNVRSQCLSLLCNLTSVAIKVHGTRLGRDCLNQFGKMLQGKQADSKDVAQLMRDLTVVMRKCVGSR